MTATRAIREFRHVGEPWVAVEAWAARKRYRTVETADHRRVYTAGRGWFAQKRMVLVLAFRDLVHVEAWLAKPWLDSGYGVRVPPEITVEPGADFGSWPRRRARAEVNELLEALEAKPITEAVDPDDDLANRVYSGIDAATNFSGSNNFRAAVSTWERILPLAERRLGRLNGITLTGVLDLAVAVLESGNSERAVGLLEDLIPDLEVVVGLDARWTINAKESLAVALAAGGNEAEARSVAQRAVQELERAFGPDHPATVDVRDRFEGRDWRTGRTKG